MNAKVYFVIWVFVAAIIAAQPVGVNYTIKVEKIAASENPDWIVRANCQDNGDGTFTITIDPSTINDPQINRIVAHEIAHTIDWDWTEEQCDNFANKVVNDGSEPIHDATY
jgi:hypothetical protein